MPDLSDFLGLWVLERVMTSPGGEVIGRLAGEARFEARDGGLVLYREQGRLVLPGHGPMPAERCYLWRQRGQRIEVGFEDGRPFHDFVAEGQAQAAHFCDPDDYAVRYDFGAWPVWTSLWRVRGPRKDYLMRSDYRRGGAGP